MAYPNFLGEILSTQEDNWVHTVRYVERRPYTGPGFNPWETERQRRVWVQEEAAWKKIQAYKKEYAALERQMARDIEIFNSHLAELERVAGKKTGLGPIGTYGGMGLAVIPGFGWAAAVLSAVSMIFEMLGGNKKKKRINQLMKIMEEAQARLQRDQQRLIAIQEAMRILVGVTARAKAENEAITARDLAKQKELETIKRGREQTAVQARMTELATIRQRSPFKVQYTSDL